MERAVTRPLLNRFAVTALCALALLFLAPLPASAAKYASFVMDAQTGEVLHAVDADARRYPASLTKMMTLYMVFEALESRRLKLDQRLTVSRRASQQPPSKLGLKPGSTMTVRDAVFALVTKSANDVAAVVAEALGGTEYNFALMMTATARKLGMNRTTFRNASGLPHKGQLSTARDMGKLARALIYHYPSQYAYFSTKSFQYRGTEYRNHNRLLDSYAGVDGIKTGYIHASGFNLVASAMRGDRRIIGVVFGAKSSQTRNQTMVKLLDKGFATQPKIVTVSRPPAKPAGDAYAFAAQSPTPTPINHPARKPASDTLVSTSVVKRISGAWGIQVGAYKRPQPAQRIADAAYRTAAEFLEDGEVAVIRDANGRRSPYYLARIHGLERGNADQACRKLKRNGIDCLQLRLRPDDSAPSVGDIGIEVGSRLESETWGVQVGAFPVIDSAEAMARRAQKVAADLLSDGIVRVVPLTEGKRRPLYRARIVGISRNDAYQACRQLKSQKIGCMVLRVKDLQTASAES